MEQQRRIPEPKNFTLDDIRQAHADGLTAREAGERLGAHRDTIYKYGRWLGLKFKPDTTERAPMPQHRRKYDVELIKEYIEAGKSYTEIAALMNTNTRTVHRYKRDVLKMPMTIQQRRYTDEEKAQAERMLDDGASYNEIERTLGVKARTVSRWFPGRGWDPREAVTYRHMMRVMNDLEGKSDADLITTSNQHSLDRLDAIT